MTHPFQTTTGYLPRFLARLPTTACPSCSYLSGNKDPTCFHPESTMMSAEPDRQARPGRRPAFTICVEISVVAVSRGWSGMHPTSARSNLLGRAGRFPRPSFAWPFHSCRNRHLFGMHPPGWSPQGEAGQPLPLRVRSAGGRRSGVCIACSTTGPVGAPARSCPAVPET